VNTAVDIFVIMFGTLACWSFAWKAYIAHHSERWKDKVVYIVLAFLMLLVVFAEITIVRPQNFKPSKMEQFPKSHKNV
jgi:hypothetical protein